MRNYLFKKEFTEFYRKSRRLIVKKGKIFSPNPIFIKSGADHSGSLPNGQADPLPQCFTPANEGVQARRKEQDARQRYETRMMARLTQPALKDRPLLGCFGNNTLCFSGLLP
jgi:hypothetical protein